MSSLLVLLLPAITQAETAVQVWVQRYNGAGNVTDAAYGVAVDSSNSVIVTGSASRSISASDCATIKYSSAGLPIWTNFYRSGAGNASGSAVVVDGNNDVIVAGQLANSGTIYHFATIKYSSDGLPLWINSYSGSGNVDDETYAVAVDATNNVIVTGYSYGSGSGSDYATIKYSSGGHAALDQPLQRPGNGTDKARAMAVDGSNNVIVTGFSAGASRWFRLRNNQVFEWWHAALDQPLQRTRERI